MSGYLQAHKLNRQVIFQRKAPGKDSYGQPNGEWKYFFKAWAHVKTVTGAGFIGQEFVAADIEISRPTASVRIRKPQTLEITADMRVLIQGKVHEIRVVLTDAQDNRYLDIGVAQGANDG